MCIFMSEKPKQISSEQEPDSKNPTKINFFVNEQGHNAISLGEKETQDIWNLFSSEASPDILTELNTDEIERIKNNLRNLHITFLQKWVRGISSDADIHLTDLASFSTLDQKDIFLDQITKHSKVEEVCEEIIDLLKPSKIQSLPECREVIHSERGNIPVTPSQSAIDNALVKKHLYVVFHFNLNRGVINSIYTRLVYANLMSHRNDLSKALN